MQLTENQLNALIINAKNVAIAAHKGQTRRNGADYFQAHVQLVADAVEDRLKPIAYLHDTVEDTEITLQDLINAGFPKYITDAVDLLTHKNNEPNLSYWTAIAGNKDAAIVKIADIKQNISDSPSDRQKDKYAQALQLFSKFGYNIS